MKSSIRLKILVSLIIILFLLEIGLILLSNLFLDDLVISANKLRMNQIFEEYRPYLTQSQINDNKIWYAASYNDVGIVIYENNTIESCYSMFLCHNTKLPSYVTNLMGETEQVSRIVDLKLIDVNQLITVYKVSDTRYIIFDKALTSIQEINQIIGQFIAANAIIIFFIGSIVVYFTSKKIAKPIIKISQYATDLAHLNFDKKLEINEQDEIGQLANNMNLISEKLNHTLNELNDKNRILKEDLEKEREIDKKRVKFFSQVSHEFKTPLTIIQGYAEGLKHNIAKSKNDINDYCDIIIEETKKMGHFVNDILNLSLYESDSFMLKKVEFDIVELVREVTNKFSENVTDKNIFMQILGVRKCIVNADKTRIEQVINNLISNAVKYVDNNGVIKVILTESNDSVTLYFFNNGEQINEDEIENIWTLFYKLENSKNQTGTGIGLAIVKTIVELHNGKYGVKNKEDGVEFYIEIPKK